MTRFSLEHQIISRVYTVVVNIEVSSLLANIDVSSLLVTV